MLSSGSGSRCTPARAATTSFFARTARARDSASPIPARTACDRIFATDRADDVVRMSVVIASNYGADGGRGAQICASGRIRFGVRAHILVAADGLISSPNRCRLQPPPRNLLQVANLYR